MQSPDVAGQTAAAAVAAAASADDASTSGSSSSSSSSLRCFDTSIDVGHEETGPKHPPHAGDPHDPSSTVAAAVSILSSTLAGNVTSVPHATRYVYAMAALACLNSCNLGYDIGSVGGAALLMKDYWGWSTWQLGLYVGSINLFSILGAICAGYVCDRYGRRRTFTFSCGIFIFGLLVQLVANGFELAMFGRIFVGIGIGLGLSIDPLYISEISPASHRGHLVSFSEIAINAGILLGFVADYAFLGLPSGMDWRVMLGLGMIMPAILIVMTLTIMPESPRWLLMKGRRQEAIAVLRRTYREGADLERVADDITRHIQADFEAEHASTWHAIARPSPVVARMLLAGVGVAAMQQFNGTESLVYFSQEILKKAGFVSRSASFGVTTLIGLSKMLFTLVAMFYVDQAGRRPLMLLSNAGMFLCLLLMAGVAPFAQLNAVMVVAMCAFMAAFSLGMGPLTWVGATEVFSTRVRAKAMSLAVSTNRLISGVIASTTLPLMEAVGATGFFLFYAGLTLLAAVYLYFFFPETRCKTLEEVEEHFESVVARKQARRRERALRKRVSQDLGKAAEPQPQPQQLQLQQLQALEDAYYYNDEEDEFRDGTVASTLSPTSTSRGSPGTSSLELFMLEGGGPDSVEGEEGVVAM